MTITFICIYICFCFYTQYIFRLCIYICLYCSSSFHCHSVHSLNLENVCSATLMKFVKNTWLCLFVKNPAPMLDGQIDADGDGQLSKDDMLSGSLS